MAGLTVGIVGAGGVGVATASALIMRGLAGRVTVYSRDRGVARGLALDFMHARPLLSHIEVRGRGLDEIDREDILVITAGHHTTPGESRLDVAPEHRGDGRRRDGSGGGRAAADRDRRHQSARRHDRVPHPPVERPTGRGDGLRNRARDAAPHRRLARECGVHPRSVHAWVVGEHGDSCVFLLDSAVVGTLPLVEFAAQRGIDLTPERLAAIERDVRDAAYEIRDLKGSAVQGIGLTVSGLVHALAHEVGALIPVSVRVGDGVCASLPCVLGPDGPSAPLWPPMTDAERKAWEHSLDVITAANAKLPI